MASEIYVFQLGDTPYVKLGYSGNAARRLANWQQMLPLPIRVLGVVDGTPGMETRLHRRLAKWRTRGEWYQVCTPFLVRLHRILPIRIEANSEGEVLRLIGPSEWDPGSLKQRLALSEKQNARLRSSLTDVRKERVQLRRKLAALQVDLRRETALSPSGRAWTRIAKLEREIRNLRRENEELRLKTAPPSPPATCYLDDEIRRTMAEAEEAVRKMEDTET